MFLVNDVTTMELNLNHYRRETMSSLKELTTTEEFDQVWEKSAEGPVFVFKQSTTCPISAAAFDEFQKYANTNGKTDDVYFLKVRESREVSNHVADVTGVKHQSPQILLIDHKSVKWNESHSNITINSIESAAL